jgi:hypothetical protein
MNRQEVIEAVDRITHSIATSDRLEHSDALVLTDFRVRDTVLRDLCESEDTDWEHVTAVCVNTHLDNIVPAEVQAVLATLTGFAWWAVYSETNENDVFLQSLVCVSVPTILLGDAHPQTVFSSLIEQALLRKIPFDTFREIMVADDRERFLVPAGKESA